MHTRRRQLGQAKSPAVSLTAFFQRRYLIRNTQQQAPTQQGQERLRTSRRRLGQAKTKAPAVSLTALWKGAHSRVREDTHQPEAGWARKHAGSLVDSALEGARVIHDPTRRQLFQALPVVLELLWRVEVLDEVALPA